MSVELSDAGVLAQQPVVLLAPATEPEPMHADPTQTPAYTDSDYSSVLASTGAEFRLFCKDLIDSGGGGGVGNSAVGFLRGLYSLETPVLRSFKSWLQHKTVTIPLLPTEAQLKKKVLVGVAATSQEADLPPELCSGKYRPCLSAPPTERCMDAFRRTSGGWHAYMEHVPSTCKTMAIWASLALHFGSPGFTITARVLRAMTPARAGVNSIASVGAHANVQPNFGAVAVAVQSSPLPLSLPPQPPLPPPQLPPQPPPQPLPQLQSQPRPRALPLDVATLVGAVLRWLPSQRLFKLTCPPK